MKMLLFTLVLMVAAPFAQAHDDSPPTQPASMHLEFANGAIHAHCTWTQGPQSPDESKMTIEWKNGGEHTPTEPPGRFEVSLFMSEMGHGSAPTQLQRVLDKSGNPLVGVYEVSSIYFEMGGKWQVNVTLFYGDGSKETQTIDLDIPGSPNHGHQH